MPATCALMTIPTICSPTPPWFMWTGVIDMTATISSCAITMAAMASRAGGARREVPRPADGVGLVRSIWQAVGPVAAR
jgi:hypothetical protein